MNRDSYTVCITTSLRSRKRSISDHATIALYNNNYNIRFFDFYFYTHKLFYFTEKVYQDHTKLDVWILHLIEETYYYYTYFTFWNLKFIFIKIGSTYYRLFEFLIMINYVSRIVNCRLFKKLGYTDESV